MDTNDHVLSRRMEQAHASTTGHRDQPDGRDACTSRPATAPRRVPRTHAAIAGLRQPVRGTRPFSPVSAQTRLSAVATGVVVRGPAGDTAWRAPIVLAESMVCTTSICLRQPSAIHWALTPTGWGHAVPSVLTRRVGHKCSIEASLVRLYPSCRRAAFKICDLGTGRFLAICIQPTKSALFHVATADRASVTVSFR